MDLLRSPTFSTYVQQLMDRNHVPGLAIAVAQDGAIASAGFGKASLNPPKDCTADTLFDIASASKSVTAASVAILVTDNEKYPHVQYDATMSSLLPNDFVLPGEDHNNVTVEDILSHRTGMAP
jgi:CubicO group peptidase (beta-lactamase class C family)